MPASPVSIPAYVEVSPSDILQGVFALEGTLNYADQTLTFVYRTRDGKGKKSEPMTFAMPVETLEAVEWKKGILSGIVVLRPRRLTTLDQVPWGTEDAVLLRIKHKHRAQAAPLVAALQDDLASTDEARRIPFQLPSANLGFTEIKGLLYLDDEYLVFEVGTGIAGGGAHKNRQTIKIEPRALVTVYLDQGVRHDKLSIQPKTRDLFRAMPGMYRRHEELVLTLSKRYREDAESLVHRITSIIELT